MKDSTYWAISGKHGSQQDFLGDVLFLKKLVERSDRQPLTNDPAHSTGLKCSCGGSLVRGHGSSFFREVIESAIGPRPYHKKKRIRKKWLKRWTREFVVVAPMALNMLVQTSRALSCTRCHQVVGLYQAIARNTIVVEPMPQGALPVYDKDLEVARIVTEPTEEKTE